MARCGAISRLICRQNPVTSDTVRKKFLTQKPYRDIDYVLALDDSAGVGSLRFQFNAAGGNTLPEDWVRER
jgi:hypothetical protein